jgi:hypothetical protein
MGPYLAVISDSFTEAFKSRVLWILLLGWTLLLAALAPFGWIEGDDFIIRSENISNRDRLLDDLQKVARGEGTDAQNRVWKALEPDFKSRIEKSTQNPSMIMRQGMLADGVSSALDEAELYDASAWPTAANRADLKETLADYQPGKLKDEELTRVNRQLIQLAFPAIRNSTTSSVWVGYAGLKLFEPLPVSREQLRPFIDGIILLGFLKLALGVIGILVAIIVTSNLIPDMFAPGSMALLLSKPISRSGLLLSKYFGGVCFILINVTYLLVGFYFLLGWRLQIWNVGLIWCIPLFLFVFMIFYSISTLVGLIWKNAIVSIVFVALFWAVCFVIGVTHEQLRGVSVELPQLTKLSSFDGNLVGTNRQGELLVWDRKGLEWKSVGGATGPERRILGPLYLADQKSVIFGRTNWAPFFGMQTDGTRLQSLQFDNDQADGSADGTKSDEPLWSEKRVDTLTELPSSTRRLKVVNDQIIAATENGIFRFNLEAARQKNESKPQTDFGRLLEYVLPTQEQPSNVNQKLTSDDVYFEPPLDFCEIPNSHDLLVVSKTTLERYRWINENNALEMVQTLELGIPHDALSLIAANEQECLIFTNKNRALRVDLNEWTVSNDINKELQSATPQELYPYKDSKFVLLMSDGKVAIIEDQGRSFEFPPQPSRVTAIAIDASGDIFYSALGNEIRKFTDGQTQLSLVANPKWSTSQWVYWTIVRPIYLVCPKPSAVDNLTHWALARKEPLSFATQTEDMEQPGQSVDLWTPIWSNTAFIVVVLAISCVYLGRQDT